MSNKKTGAIYDGNEMTIVLKVDKDLHNFILKDATESFRSIPMHIMYLLTNRMRAKQADLKSSVDTNTPLYTEEELKDIYKQQNGEI